MTLASAPVSTHATPMATAKKVAIIGEPCNQFVDIAKAINKKTDPELMGHDIIQIPIWGGKIIKGSTHQGDLPKNHFDNTASNPERILAPMLVKLIARGTTFVTYHKFPAQLKPRVIKWSITDTPEAAS